MHLNIESVLSSVSFPAINLFSAYSVEIATAQKKILPVVTSLKNQIKKVLCGLVRFFNTLFR